MATINIDFGSFLLNWKKSIRIFMRKTAYSCLQLDRVVWALVRSATRLMAESLCNLATSFEYVDFQLQVSVQYLEMSTIMQIA